METITTGKWKWKLKEAQGLKLESYGDDYSASARIKVVNGEVHVENLITKDDFTKQDFDEIEEAISTIGYDRYKYIRYKNGKPKLVTRKIKNVKIQQPAIASNG